MIVGMVVVFAFLGLLIAGIHLIRIVGEDKLEQSAQSTPNTQVNHSTTSSQAPVAVIAAAVNKYRQNHK